MNTASAMAEGRTLTQIQASPLGRATLGDQLRRHAQSRPSKAAIVSYRSDGRRTVTTYAALDRGPTEPPTCSSGWGSPAVTALR